MHRRLKRYLKICLATKNIIIMMLLVIILNIVSLHQRWIRLEYTLSLSSEDLLVQHIKARMHQPSIKPYNLNAYKSDYSQVGQTNELKEIFQNQTNGFFVEAGAADGETYSNTLYWEKSLNWTGLLIETADIPFKKLLNKNRKSWALKACITMSQDTIQKFLVQPVGWAYGYSAYALRANNNETFMNIHHPKVQNLTVSVECYPLHLMLNAIGVKHVDLLSLDVEGVDMQVLQWIEWDKVDIRVIMVEHSHIEGGNRAATKYMATKGYRLHKELSMDAIFIKDDTD